MKRLSYNALIQYFDLDRNNCLMAREDFCNIITDFINDPEKERNELLEHLKNWTNERIDAGWEPDERIITLDEVFEFWETDTKPIHVPEVIDTGAKGKVYLSDWNEAVEIKEMILTNFAQWYISDEEKRNHLYKAIDDYMENEGTEYMEIDVKNISEMFWDEDEEKERER
tara:strand:+ start:100 stop:609 length:510 start_codon:yes stop_codon:yes gene_type:complete